MHPHFPGPPYSSLRFSCLALPLLAFCPALALGQAPHPAAPPPANALASRAPIASQPAPPAQIEATPEEVGDALMAHQRYQAAIQAYRKAPLDKAATWNKMGVAYQLMFDNRDALACYRQALRLDSRNADVLNNIGSIDMEQKLYGKAEREYRKAVRLNPGAALFHKNLGTALLAERKYKKGWQAYQAALDLDPTVFSHPAGARVQNPATLQDRGAMNFYMAKSCAHAGLVAQAVEYLRLALDEGFTNPKKILADADLGQLRKVPAFQQLMASQGVYLAPLAAHTPVQQ